MECIIADAGPIIALCKIGQFNLVTQLFNQCLITQTVYEEVMTGTDRAVDCLQRAIKSNKVTVKPSSAIELELLKILDEGEAASIALALENSGCALLIDEAKGRQIAEHLNIPIIGLAGLLLLAKKKQMINVVMPLLFEIRNNGYWLSDKFLKEIAKLSNEKWTKP